MRNWQLAVVAGSIACAAAAAQEVVYDTLYITDQELFDRSFVSCIGTPPNFTSLRDAQVADDFLIQAEAQVLEVVGDYTTKAGGAPTAGVWVQFYADNNGVPSRNVYADAIVPLTSVQIVDLGLIRGLPQYNFGRRYIVDVSSYGFRLAPGRWWLSIQPVDPSTGGDWYWMLRDLGEVINLDMHARDGTLHHAAPYNNIPGVINRPEWTALGVIGFGGPGTVPMRVTMSPTTCYADCDTSTGPNVLDIFDFLCFQNRFAGGAAYACDCDTTSGAGVCDIFDFLCFQNAFAAGCP